jgi:hypothetical protein
MLARMVTRVRGIKRQSAGTHRLLHITLVTTQNPSFEQDRIHVLSFCASKSPTNLIHERSLSFRVKHRKRVEIKNGSEAAGYGCVARIRSRQLRSQLPPLAL